MKQKTYYLLMALLAVVFFGSGTMLVKKILESRAHEADFTALASQFPEVATPMPDGQDELAQWGGHFEGDGQGGAGMDGSVAASQGAEFGEEQGEPQGEPERVMDVSPQAWKLWWEQEAAGRFATYQSLKAENADMVGWIRIEGTKVDYPVMQTPDRPDYYLHRDFNGKKSNYGIPYMAENCRYEEPGTGLLIYGHHMRNGGMFAALQNYTKESFYRQHPYIQFDTVGQAGSYEIVSVVKVDASDNVTPWRNLLFPKDSAAFEEAWGVFERQSFYRTGAAPEYGQQLLALVTCEYTLKDGRLMVVARRVS